MILTLLKHTSAFRGMCQNCHRCAVTSYSQLSTVSDNRWDLSQSDDTPRGCKILKFIQIIYYIFIIFIYSLLLMVCIFIFYYYLFVIKFLFLICVFFLVLILNIYHHFTCLVLFSAAWRYSSFNWNIEVQVYILSVLLFINNIYFYWNDGIFLIFLITIIIIHFTSFFN